MRSKCVATPLSARYGQVGSKSVTQGVRCGGLRDTGSMHGALEFVLEGLIELWCRRTTPLRGSVEWLACGKTQNHGQDEPAHGYLRSSASGMCTPPLP